MSDLNLHLSADTMMAYIDIPADVIQPPSLSFLQSLLKRNHLCFGINESALQKIATGKLSGNDIPVAVGKPLKPGIPGHLEWYIEYTETNQPLERKDGTVDHRQLQQDINVKKGDKIARMVKAVPGLPGISVKGEDVVPNPAEDISLSMGDGVIVTNGIITATRNGSVIYNGTKIDVSTIRTIDGDIDYSTGNISFNGVLRIKGTIRSGFKISAIGDILICGDVEDAEIKSGGSVIVLGNVIGASRGIIQCNGSITLKHVSNFRLEAGKQVTIKEVSFNTTIISNGTTSINSITGGSVTSCSITASSVGGNENTTTILDITRSERLFEEKYNLMKRFANHAAERAVLYDKMFMLVRDQMDEKGILCKKDIDTLESLKTNTLLSIETSAEIQSKLTSIEEAEMSHYSNAFIKAERIFPGVVIKVPGKEQTINAEEKNFILDLKS